MKITAAIYGGDGEIWFNNLRVEPVSDSVPTTDDSHWHLNGPFTPLYSVAQDPSTPRNDRPTTCITCEADENTSQLETYNAVNRDPKEYLGHRIRLSVMLKAEDIRMFGPYIAVRGNGDRMLNKNGGENRSRPIGFLKGMWSLYSVEANVPKDAGNISTGICLTGKGKLWVDDFKIEIIDDQ
jgi:hypothetical protein